MPPIERPPSTRNPVCDAPPSVLLRGDSAGAVDANLLDGFREVVRSKPERTAIIDGTYRLTYGELDQETNRLARHLLRQGVKPGDFVGISMGRSAELLVAILAVTKSGAAYLPLDPSYPAERIARMVGIAKPVLVLGSGGQTDCSVDRDVPEAPWRECSAEPLPGNDDPEAPLYCIFTSGSTGEPKGAVVKRGGFANLTTWYRREFGFGPEDRTLLVSAPGFDLTQKNFFTPLASGGSLVICPDGSYDPGLIVRLISEHGLTVLNWTPSAFYPLLELDLAKLQSLRLVVLGGEPISIPKISPWLNHPLCRAEIANTYGPTECTDICAFHRVDRANLHDFPTIPVGKPVTNVQLALLDAGLRPVEGTGELVIGGAGIGLGYLGDPVRTAEKFVPNPLPDHFEGPFVYRTGDLMRVLPGGVLDFVGRTDHQVKVRGFRIELGEIEAVLAGFPGIREVAVVVSGGGEGGGLVAFHSPESLEPAALEAHVRARLPEFMVPRFVGMDALPMTPHGKLDRVALAKLKPPGPVAVVPVSDSTQCRLQAIWKDVLENPAIGPDDGFFELGGDSIQLARMHGRVMKEFQRMFPITDLFAHPTIRSLARHLDGRSDQRMTSRERMDRQRKALAAAQKTKSL